MTGRFEEAREARRRVQKVCDRLLRPSVEAFDASAAELEGAIECLLRLESALASWPGGRAGRQAVAAEIKELHREVGKACALTEAAGNFCAGWARLINANPEDAMTSYASSGKSSTVISIGRGRVALDG